MDDDYSPEATELVETYGEFIIFPSALIESLSYAPDFLMKYIIIGSSRPSLPVPRILKWPRRSGERKVMLTPPLHSQFLYAFHILVS